MRAVGCAMCRVPCAVCRVPCAMCRVPEQECLLSIQPSYGVLHAALYLRVFFEPAGELCLVTPERRGRPVRKGHVKVGVLLPCHHIAHSIDRDDHEPDQDRPVALTTTPPPPADDAVAVAARSWRRRRVWGGVTPRNIDFWAAFERHQPLFKYVWGRALCKDVKVGRSPLLVGLST